ncbi:hypothetical protein PORY_001998 [Pneumocystis oryctolagi]|uniref:Uncharacterized protein n=1 Tax=Pneumocystis oryctolagi TaxID=42067 RepID=A0ACB7CB46_9ASCO|nr:hypothetical protein PORY_001998 [Pneumocystis oryctolagi]
MVKSQELSSNPQGIDLYARYAFAGAVCCAVTHGALTPVDVVKTRIQLEPTIYKNMFSGFRQIVRNEGVGALLTGFGPTAAGYFLQGGFKFGGYEFWKQRAINYFGLETATNNRTAVYLGSSAIAEFFADVALCPLEATRIRLVSQPTFATGLVSGFLRIFKNEGVLAFYSGFGPILFKQIPYTMAKFVVYERVAEAIYSCLPVPKNKLSSNATTFVNLTSGLAAGVAAAIISQPADTLLSKINKVEALPGETTMSRLIKYAKELGIRGSFTGIGARIVMVGILTSGQFAIYGDIKKAIGATGDLVYDDIVRGTHKEDEDKDAHAGFSISPFDEEHTNPFADAISLGKSQSKDLENMKKLEMPTYDDDKSNQDESIRSWFTPNKLQLNVSSFRSYNSGRSPISCLQNVELDYDPLGHFDDTGSMNPDISNDTRAASLNLNALNKMSPLVSKLKNMDLDDKSEVSDELSKSNTFNTIETPLHMFSEQNNKAMYNVSVGDPHIIGDIASAHTVYKVTSRVTSNTSNPVEYIVYRRYRDFLWLYNSLHSNNPGVIVPSPPEKQAVGRFQENFIEFRRNAFERMLRKIVTHPILQKDSYVKMFLESDTFTVDIKAKEKVPVHENKGFISSIGEAFANTFSGKFVEQDNWFNEQKQIFDLLDLQFKGMSKAIDAVVKQKKDLAQTIEDLSHALLSLSNVELDKTLSFILVSFSELQIRIKEFYERQAQQDILIFGCMVDEYIRLIGSAKHAFSLRQKAYLNWQASKTNLSKCRSEKMKSQVKLNQNDSESSTEILNAEKRCEQLKNDFDNISNILKEEIERFGIQKIEDFRGSVETFLESVIEAQKELIELWETYLVELERKNVIIGD